MDLDLSILDAKPSPDEGLNLDLSVLDEETPPPGPGTTVPGETRPAEQPGPPSAPRPGYSLPQAYELARDRDPDRTARVLDLSSVLASPPDMVDRNLDAAAAAAARQNRPDFGRLEAEAPATAKHLATPRHMAVSKDDTDNMGAVERFMKTSPWTYGLRMLARGYFQSVQTSFKILDDSSRLAERGLLAIGVSKDLARREGGFERLIEAYEPPEWAGAPADFPGKLMAAVGRLPMDLGRLMLLSKTLPGGAATAMGLEGAVQGGAEDGWAGAAMGGVHGALFGGILHTFGYAPKLLQSPLAGSFGFGMTLHETGDMDEALAQGLVFAGFHAPQFVKGLNDVYAKSKTLARAPAVAEAHLAEVLRDAGYPETSYLPARDVQTVFSPFFQAEGNVRLKTFLHGIGVTLEQYYEAGRLDLDLSFPTAKLVRFTQSPEGQALLERTKWTPFADVERAKALADLREKAETPATEPVTLPGEAPAEGRAGNVLDLSNLLPGETRANPAELLRRIGLDPETVAREVGPIADTSMPVAEITADPRFSAALRMLGYDGVKFAEGGEGKSDAADLEIKTGTPAGLRPGETPQAGTYRVTFAKEPVEDVTRDRIILREYLDGITPESIKALRDKRPEDYLAILKSIVRRLFPKGADFTFRTVNGERDYEHLLSDSLREEYIHTLPSTMKRSDIHVEFQNGDIAKAYFIKKYFDPDIQRDIWDIIVSHNNEIRTKIARRESRGRNSVEGMIGDGFRASVPSTPAGADASAATPSEVPNQLLITIEQKVKKRNEKISQGEAEGKEESPPASSDAPGEPGPRAERPKRLAGSDENIRQGEAEGKGKRDGLVKPVIDLLDPIQIRAENALPLEVALTAGEITHAEARRAASDNQHVQAITIPGDRVVIIADRLGSPDDAVKLWVHEQGIHQGLRVLLGKDLDVWRDNLIETYGGAEGLRQVADVHRIDLSTREGLRRAAEERFALIADKTLLAEALTPDEAGLWARFVQFFRDSLRRRGVTVEFTDQEIARLARDSLRAIMSMERPKEDGVDLRPRDVVELALARETMGMERAFEEGDVLALSAADPALGAELREYQWLFDEAQRQAEAAFAREVVKERALVEKQWRAEANTLYERTEGWRVYKRIVDAGGLSEPILREMYDPGLVAELKRAANRFEGFKERNRRQRLVVRETETLPDELAREVGFTEASRLDDLVQFLVTQDGRREFLDRHVAARRLVVEDAYRAEEVVATDAYERLLEKQSEIFGRLAGRKPQGTSEIKRIIEEQTGIKSVPQAISEKDALVASLKRQQEAAREAFKEGVKAGRGEVRAEARVSMAMLRQKRLEDAFEASERLREALARVKERTRVKEEVDKALKSVSEAVDSRTVDFEFSEHIKALAARFGFVTARSKMPQDPHNMRPLRELLEENLPPDSLAGMVVPEKFFDPNWRPGGTARRAGTTWRDMSFDELVEFGEVIRALAMIGRKRNHALSYESRRTFDDMAGLAAQTTMTLKGRVERPWPGYVEVPGRPGRAEKLAEGVKRFAATLIKPEFIFRAADGWEYDGPNYRYGFMPMVRAMARELELWERKGKEYKAVLEPFLGNLHQWGRKKYRIEGVPQLLSKEEMIAVALNSGNEGNLTALRNGYGWTDVQIKAITDRLTQSEWTFVENVWALIDSLFPMLSEEYRKIYGRPLRKVEAQAYDTPFGIVRGGYYPLVFDPKVSEKVEMFSDRELAALAMENVWQQRGPASGMIKERQGGKLPPLLKLDVIERHLRDTIHYLSFAAPLRDVYKFVTHPDVKAAYLRHLGRERYRQIVPWLQSLASEERGDLYEIERGITRIRRGATMVNMGLKTTVALTQPLAYTQTIDELGFVPAMSGLARFTKNPHEGLEFVRSKSVFFRAREKSLDRDIRDATKHMDVTAYRIAIGGRVLGPEDLQDGFFALIRLTDAMTAAPTWISAYEVGLRKFKGADAGATEAQAVDYADMVMRTTQGSGLPIDLAKVQRGDAWMKLFTMFYSFFNLFANRAMERIEQTREKALSPTEIHAAFVGFATTRRLPTAAVEFGKSIRELARSAVWLWLAPAAIQAFLMSQEETGPEDVAYNILSYPFAAVPLIRDVGNPALQYLMTGKTYGYQGSPAGRAGVEAVNLVARSSKAARAVATGNRVTGAEFEALMKSALMAAGYWYGLPSRQAWITYEGARDLATGKTNDPRRLLFAGKKD